MGFDDGITFDESRWLVRTGAFEVDADFLVKSGDSENIAITAQKKCRKQQ